MREERIHHVAVCPTCRRIVHGKETGEHEHPLVLLKLVELEGGVRLTKVENEELWSRLRWLPKLAATAARHWEADRVEPAAVERLLDLYLSTGLYEIEHQEVDGQLNYAVKIAIALTVHFISSDLLELRRRRERGLILVEVVEPRYIATVAWELSRELNAHSLRVRAAPTWGAPARGKGRGVLILYGTATPRLLNRALAWLEKGSGFSAVILVTPLRDATLLKERAGGRLAKWLRGVEVV